MWMGLLCRCSVDADACLCMMQNSPVCSGYACLHHGPLPRRRAQDQDTAQLGQPLAHANEAQMVAGEIFEARRHHEAPSIVADAQAYPLPLKAGFHSYLSGPGMGQRVVEALLSHAKQHELDLAAEATLGAGNCQADLRAALTARD